MSDAELEAIRARHGLALQGDPDRVQPGSAEHDINLLLARLDAAEARERALREALVVSHAEQHGRMAQACDAGACHSALLAESPEVESP